MLLTIQLNFQLCIHSTQLYLRLFSFPFVFVSHSCFVITFILILELFFCLLFFLCWGPGFPGWVFIWIPFSFLPVFLFLFLFFYYKRQTQLSFSFLLIFIVIALFSLCSCCFCCSYCHMICGNVNCH